MLMREGDIGGERERKEQKNTAHMRGEPDKSPYYLPSKTKK